MELGFAPTSGEGVMNVGNGGCEYRSCLVRVGPHEDAVAVIFIGNEEVVVATIGWVWESACLVRVDNVFGFMDFSNC